MTFMGESVLPYTQPQFMGGGGGFMVGVRWPLAPCSAKTHLYVCMLGMAFVRRFADISGGDG